MGIQVGLAYYRMATFLASRFSLLWAPFQLPPLPDLHRMTV